METSDIFSAPVIVGLFLGMILAGSLISNVFQFVLYKKEIKSLKDQDYDANLSTNDGHSGHEEGAEVARKNSSKPIDEAQYIEHEIKLTKQKLKSIANKKDSKAMVNALNFRLAYLNIEKSYTRHKRSKSRGWDFVIDKLRRLLNLLVLKHTDNTPVEDIEHRVSELKTKIQFIDGNNNSDHYQNSLNLLNAFIEKYRNSVSDKQTIDDHLTKMESAVKGFEREDVQQYITRSNRADEFIDTSRGHIDQLNDLLSEKNKRILQLESRLDQVKKSHDNAEESTAYKAMLSQVERYKVQNKDLKSSIENLESMIDEYRNHKDRSDAELKSKIISGDLSEDEVEQHSENLNKISDAIAEDTNKELTHLKSLLGRQRMSILKLDESLDDARHELERLRHEGEDKDTVIKSLQSSNKESDMCITTLENTLEELINSRAETNKNNEKTLEKLNHELKKVKSELDRITANNEVNEDIVMYLHEALEANSLEDLTALYFQKLIDLSSDPSVELVFGEKVVSISKKGKMDKKDHILLDHMGVNETNIASDELSIRYRTKYLKGIVRSDGDDEKFKQSHKKIIGISKVTDKIIEKIGYTQMHAKNSAKLETFKSSIKQVAYDLDKNMEYNSAKNKSILAVSIGEAGEIVKTSLGDSNIALPRIESELTKIREKTLKEFDSTESLRVSTRTMFLNLIKTLEKK